MSLSNKLLLQAVETSNIEDVKRFLKYPDINLDDPLDTPLLESAVLEEDPRILQLFLEHGANPNFRTPSSKYLLHLAIEVENLANIHMLLTYGACVNVCDNSSSTPIHYAIEHQYKLIVQMLLYYGADVNVFDYSGRSPLHYACAGQDENIVELLLQQTKININIQDNNINISPLFWAITNGHQATVRLLLEHNADVNLVDRNGRTVLHYATKMRQVRMVQMVLETRRADPDIACRQFGLTPLAEAIQAGSLEIVKLLINYGASPNIQDFYSKTPLHFAILKNHLPIFEFLIENSARTNLKTSQEYNQALHLAVHLQRREMVQILRRNGVRANITNYNDITPLHEDTRRDDSEIVRSPLKAGGSTDEKDHFKNFRVLHVAVDNERLKNVQALLKFGADVNAQDVLKRTPMHVAATKKSPELVHMLVNYGASLGSEDSGIESPVQLAIRQGYKKVTELMIKYLLLKSEANKYVNPVDIHLVNQKFIELKRKCYKELRKMKKERIDVISGLTLFKLLTEEAEDVEMNFWYDDVKAKVEDNYFAVHYPMYSSIISYRIENITVGWM